MKFQILEFVSEYCRLTENVERDNLLKAVKYVFLKMMWGYVQVQLDILFKPICSFPLVQRPKGDLLVVIWPYDANRLDFCLRIGKDRVKCCQIFE